MDVAHTAAEKLQHLLVAHKILVQILSEELPDKIKYTGADLILPTLIYIFVHYNVPNVWLNLMFIKRFRNAEFLHTGEAPYCLTNFEAVVGFLETVTMAGLGIEPDGLNPEVDYSVLHVGPGGDSGNGDHQDSIKPDINSIPRESESRKSRSSSYLSTNNRLHGSDPLSDPLSRSRSGSSPPLPPRQSIPTESASLPPPASAASTATAFRRLSLIHPTDIAASAVSTADQSFKTIGSTFGNSYRFILGKISPDKKEDISAESYPNTLDDARRVMGLPPLDERDREKSTKIDRKGSDANLLSRWTGLVKSDDSRDHSREARDSRNSLPSKGSYSSSRIPPPIDRFVVADVDSLTISDIRELHEDYIRLVKYLKSMNAFS